MPKKIFAEKPTCSFLRRTKYTICSSSVQYQTFAEHPSYDGESTVDKDPEGGGDHDAVQLIPSVVTASAYSSVRTAFAAIVFVRDDAEAADLEKSHLYAKGVQIIFSVGK